MSDLMQTPADAFERVYVVNLDRRPDRWRQFAERLPNDWPFAQPIRFAAVDGQVVTPPAWWKAGKGAWGIYRSFLTILERCLNENVRSVLMLEDDACFCEDFSAKAMEWLRHVPSDWGMLYLGGQHCKKAQQINPWLLQPQNVNRCHAWAVNHTMMRETYNHLNEQHWGTTSAGAAKHIDHHLGALHQRHFDRFDQLVLCPPGWFVGQAAGRSNICGKELGLRLWENIPVRLSPIPQVTRQVIAVLGPYRGGTSCVAGCLHRLGVSMGHAWATIPANPTGTYEAVALAKFCRASFQEWRMTESTNRRARIAGLRSWALSRQRDIRAPAPIGAKHPTLCLMIPEMLEAWPAVKFVAVHRPENEVVQSFAKCGWCNSPAVTEQTAKLLIETRDQTLHRLPDRQVLHVDYHALLANPASELNRIVGFASIAPSDAQMDEAIKFVNPKLCSVGVQKRM